MQITHKLTSMFLSLAALVVTSIVAFAADPGTVPGPQAGADSDFPGPLLVYNVYASSASNPTTENTRISVTNVDDTDDISVHFYYIDGETCSVADNYICLTKNQTATLYAADVDPGTKGYIIAMATFEDGTPNAGGRLLGDEYIKLATGHAAQLPAQVIAVSSIVSNPGEGSLVAVNAPRVLAIPSIPSPGEGNSTLLVVNRLGGDLRVSMKPIGDIFGILFDELENPYSWTTRAGCQLMATLGLSFPRSIPRLTSVVSPGRVGWMKFWSTSASDWDFNNDTDFDTPGRAISGCYLNFSSNVSSSATGFTGGRNLAQLTVNAYPVFPTADADDVNGDFLIFPVFPSNCGFDED